MRKIEIIMLLNKILGAYTLSNLKRIDEENKAFFKEVSHDVLEGNLSIDDILGFNLESPGVLVPWAPCAHLAPSIYNFCEDVKEEPSTSILTLLPIYDTIIYPIASYADIKNPIKKFEECNDFSFRDFIIAVEKGKVIPYFNSDYCEYTMEFIEPFLEPGMPRISSFHMELIRRHNLCNAIDGDCDVCASTVNLGKEDIRTIFSDGREYNEACGECLSRAYMMGVTKERLLETDFPSRTLCALMDILASRNLDSAFKTNCPIAKDALGLFTEFPVGFDNMEKIVTGLKVNFTSDLDFQSYLELIDGKTTRAVREVIKKMMEAPFASKYSEILNSKLFEYNKEIEEVANSRAAKFYNSVSDMAVYGGTKYIEQQSKSYVKVGKEPMKKISEGLASKLMDIHAKATGKDWTIAQIYRTRKKIEKCKNK